MTLTSILKPLAAFRGLFLLSILCIELTSFAQLKADSTKKVNWAAVPILTYSNTTGLGFGALTQAFYKVNPKDTISPTSSTGMTGLYTTNKTFFYAAFQRLYLNQDKWRLLMAAGGGNINFQYWQELGDLNGIFIGFNTRVNFVVARAERKVFNQLYAGLNAVYSQAKTGYDLPDWVPEEIKNQTVNMNNFGYLLNFDKRDHQMNPYGGYNIEFKQAFYAPWLNSDYTFNNTVVTYNHYYKLKNKRHILATRFKADLSAGDVPFQGQNVVGQDDIRGYSEGRYRDNQVYALQAEYRWRFYKKMGMVGFLGVASAVEHFSDLTDNALLPGVGVGLRYMIIEKERINIGFDVAKGKDDWGLYFRIGESFGR